MKKKIHWPIKTSNGPKYLWRVIRRVLVDFHGCDRCGRALGIIHYPEGDYNSGEEGMKVDGGEFCSNCARFLETGVIL